MPTHGKTLGCCGISEIYDLGFDNRHHSEFFETVIEVLDEEASGMIIFTDNVNERKEGKEIAAIIRKKKLGRIVSSPIATNPVHDNETKVQAWVWKPIERKVRQYVKRYPSDDRRLERM